MKIKYLGILGMQMYLAVVSFHSFVVSDLSFFKSLFIYFEREKGRERECMHEWMRGKETGRERIPSRLHAVSTGPSMGLDPPNYEIGT